MIWAAVILNQSTYPRPLFLTLSSRRRICLFQTSSFFNLLEEGYIRLNLNKSSNSFAPKSQFNTLITISILLYYRIIISAAFWVWVLVASATRPPSNSIVFCSYLSCSRLSPFCLSSSPFLCSFPRIFYSRFSWYNLSCFCSFCTKLSCNFSRFNPSWSLFSCSNLQITSPPLGVNLVLTIHWTYALSRRLLEHRRWYPRLWYVKMLYTWCRQRNIGRHFQIIQAISPPIIPWQLNVA